MTPRQDQDNREHKGRRRQGCWLLTEVPWPVEAQLPATCWPLWPDAAPPASFLQLRDAATYLDASICQVNGRRGLGTQLLQGALLMHVQLGGVQHLQHGTVQSGLKHRVPSLCRGRSAASPSLHMLHTTSPAWLAQTSAGAGMQSAACCAHSRQARWLSACDGASAKHHELLCTSCSPVNSSGPSCLQLGTGRLIWWCASLSVKCCTA